MSYSSTPTDMITMDKLDHFDAQMMAPSKTGFTTFFNNSFLTLHLNTESRRRALMCNRPKTKILALMVVKF